MTNVMITHDLYKYVLHPSIRRICLNN